MAAGAIDTCHSFVVYGGLGFGSLALWCPEENVWMSVSVCVIKLEFSKAEDVTGDMVCEVEFEGA